MRRRGLGELERRLVHHSGNRDDRYELHRLQRDQLVRRGGGAVYGGAFKRGRGERDLDGERGRREQRAGHNYFGRPIYTAQLPDGGPGFSDRDGCAERQFEQHGNSGGDGDAGVPATADAGERVPGRKRDAEPERLPGRVGRDGGDYLWFVEHGERFERRIGNAGSQHLHARRHGLHLLHGNLHGAGHDLDRQHLHCGHGEQFGFAGDQRSSAEYGRAVKQSREPPGRAGSTHLHGQLGREQQRLRHLRGKLWTAAVGRWAHWSKTAAEGSSC